MAKSVCQAAPASGPGPRAYLACWQASPPADSEAGPGDPLSNGLPVSQAGCGGAAHRKLAGVDDLCSARRRQQPLGIYGSMTPLCYRDGRSESE